MTETGSSYTGTQMSDSTNATKLVAFIFSPLQALNLLEYSNRFRAQMDFVVVGGASSLEPVSRGQIEKVLEQAPPREVLYHEGGIWPTRPIRAHRNVSSTARKIRASLQSGPHCFLVGEYRSAFSWAVIHSLGDVSDEIIVVDDGTAMLRIDRRSSVLRSSKVRRQKLKELIFQTIGIPGTVPRSSLTFFTNFPIGQTVAQHDVIVRNDYRFIATSQRQLPPDDEFVYVIGNPLLEVGVVDSGDVELALRLIDYASTLAGRDVIYLAHRRERMEKLDHLSHAATVVIPNVPFELYAATVGKRPSVLVGYQSSLFTTAAQIFGDAIEIISVQLPRDRIGGAWCQFIDNVYEYYRTDFPTSISIKSLPAGER